MGKSVKTNRSVVLFFIVSLLFVHTSWLRAMDGVPELMLRDVQGRMLSEVSGMTANEHFVFFIEQRSDRLYFITRAQLAAAFNRNAEFVTLDSVALTGDLPQHKSWEAVSLAHMEGHNRLFLTHEYDAEGDIHQVYVADIDMNATQVALGPIQLFVATLPLSNNSSIPFKRRVNYGYEALAWLATERTLLAIPELAGQSAVAINSTGRFEFAIADHDYRLSDLSMTSEHCAVFTSFCHPSDSVCKSSDQRSTLSLATANLSGKHLRFIDHLDITEQQLALGFDPALNNSTERSRLFNAEAITVFEHGFLLANDNTPQGKARTVVRFMPNISVDENCHFRQQ